MTEEHKPKKRFSLKLKLGRWDIISIIAVVIFLTIITIPAILPKEGCEVARPGFECASLEEVMIENCEYWGEFVCDSDNDVSLPQIEWYIQNLCEQQNRYHNTGLDCSNLKSACNDISDTQVCPVSFR